MSAMVANKDKVNPAVGETSLDVVNSIYSNYSFLYSNDWISTLLNVRFTWMLPLTKRVIPFDSEDNSSKRQSALPVLQNISSTIPAITEKPTGTRIDFLK